MRTSAKRRGTAVIEELWFGQDSDASRALLERLPWAVFFKEADGRLTYLNRAAGALLGAEPSALIGRDDVCLVPAAAEEVARDDARVLGGEPSFEIDYPVAGGASIRILRIPVAGAHRPVGFWSIAWELGDGHRRRQELEDQLFLFQTLTDNLPDCIYFKDRDSRFTWVNQYMMRKFDKTALHEVLGKTDFDMFTGEHAGQAFRDEQEIVRTGRPLVNVEEKETLPTGEVRWVSTTKLPLRDPHGQIVGTFGMSRDITERKLAEEQLARHVLYDSLTELPNRTLFLNRLEHLLGRAARRGPRAFLFGLLHLDVDRFKAVNDSLGHKAGDALVNQVARRLETCLRPGDTLARLGGDEFAVLLEDIGGESDAVRAAEQIQQAMTEPFRVAGKDIYVSASMGIALSSTGYGRPEEMLRDADTAMYRAKSKGRSRHEVFDADMHRRAVALLDLETDLRRAVERGECRMHYQPIVDMRTQEIRGFEGLIRWQHPTRGLVMPGDFIPLAEETGLIGPMGIWAMREACRQARQWHQKFPQHPPLSMAVNLSANQLAEPDVVDRIAGILAETGLDPHALVVEITESTLMQDVQAGAAALQRLRDLAVRISLDDFGTGYSSLSYLQSFPVNILKIDRSFVSRMSTPGGPFEIVRAVVALSHALNISVTAEGVETAEQLAALRALDCNNAQGFYFARPLPPNEIEELLAHGIRLAGTGI